MIAAEVKSTSRPEVRPILRHLDSWWLSVMAEYYPSEILLQKEVLCVGGRQRRLAVCCRTEMEEVLIFKQV